MIPDEVVDQVRESADIVQIIGEYVQLKRSGADYRGPCPFHQGTHRNFSVHPRKKIYHCFVCGETGDVFRFLQQRLGIEWPAAVKLAGEKTGIEVRDIQRRQEGPDPREPLWEANAAAADYFRRVLWEEPIGAAAREYLEGRGISQEVAQRAGLGFAPAEIGLMRGYLHSLGLEDGRLLEVGLLVQREDGSEPRPRFRSRLMFPIQDAVGRYVGFGGRLLGPGEPKYLNSPDSPAFTKGRLLYGLHWARSEIRREDRALVVEGYFDVIGLISAGINTAVGPLGTALTDDQAALLRRYTKNAYLLYDSDRAGLVASFRSGDALLRHGVAVRVVTLPVGEDPDSFVRAHGADGIEAQVAEAVDVFERKIQLLNRAGAFTQLHRKRRALDRLLPTIRATSDPLTRELYVGRTSDVTGIDAVVLYREIGMLAPGVVPAPPDLEHGRSGESVGTARRAVRGDQRPSGAHRGATAERELLRAMLHRPAHIESVAEKLGPENFRDLGYRRIYERLLVAGGEMEIQRISFGLDEEEIAVLEHLMQERDAVIDVDRIIGDSIAFVRARSLDEEMRRIDRLLAVADNDQQTALIRQKTELNRERGVLGKGGFKAFSPQSRGIPQSEIRDAG
jgi:DNA primase